MEYKVITIKAFTLQELCFQFPCLSTSFNVDMPFNSTTTRPSEGIIVEQIDFCSFTLNPFACLLPLPPFLHLQIRGNQLLQLPKNHPSQPYSNQVTFLFLYHRSAISLPSFTCFHIHIFY